MNQLHTVIVEDNLKSAKLLVHFLNTYCPSINIVGVAHNVKDAIKLINETKPKVLFLDIMLDGLDSFELLEKVDYKEAKIVFVTSYEKYAIKAFEYNAVDYLLKPINIKKIIATVDKLHKDVMNENYTFSKQINNLTSYMQNMHKAQSFIAVPTLKKVEFIPLENLMYLKSDGSYTVFYLSDKSSIIASKNIGNYEDITENANFFRIHKSYIVNLEYVKRIDKLDGHSCVLKNNVSLPIAKRRFEGLMQYLNLK